MSAIIDKIRKLLSLSKSSNANEAAAAAAAAQRLMTEHQIAEAELECGEQHERATLADDPIDTFGWQTPLWKEQLLGSLVQLNGCMSWKQSRWENGTCVRKVQIVGRPSDVATVRYLYAWLTVEIERLAQRDAKGRGRSYANSYRVGAVTGCVSAMRIADRQARQTAPSAALVRLDAREEEARTVAAQLELDIKKARPAAFERDEEAYRAGVRAGAQLHTGAKLGEAGARLLGSGS
jgi:hypothetical protein